ncbi:MAG: DNA replication/repair protein RecF [Rickettsiaceae bacterium]
MQVINQLKKLSLTNYRNFEQFNLEPNDNKIKLLVGDNGTGKTNILESISLLSPGRGLRFAKLEDICLNQKPWKINAHVEGKFGTASLISYFKSENNRKIVEFNGSIIPNNELCKILNIVWLTTQMDYLFIESAANRRKFFDRIVYNFHCNHANNLNKYENYISQRNQALQQDRVDNKLLDIIEQKLTNLAFDITSAKVNTMCKLQNAIDSLGDDFMKITLKIHGEIEEKILAKYNKEEICEFVLKRFNDMRNRDKISRRTNFGINKSDFTAIYNNKEAKFCSTGQQKSMLITIVFSQIISIIENTNIAPILLLDEVLTHLDSKARSSLLNILLNLNVQTWITTTDLNLIEIPHENFNIINIL